MDRALASRLRGPGFKSCSGHYIFGGPRLESVCLSIYVCV